MSISKGKEKVAFGENPKVSYGDKNQCPSTRMGIAALLRKTLFEAIQYKNAKEMKSLQKEDFENQKVLLYGNVPALAFYFSMEPAISTTWPDLDSNPVDWMEEELMALEVRPLVVIRKTEPTSDSFVVKQEMLQDYMSANHYAIAYENNGYTVYKPLEP